MKKAAAIIAIAFVLAFAGCYAISSSCRADYLEEMAKHDRMVYLGEAGGHRWMMSDGTSQAYLIQEKID